MHIWHPCCVVLLPTDLNELAVAKLQAIEGSTSAYTRCADYAPLIPRHKNTPTRLLRL